MNDRVAYRPFEGKAKADSMSNRTDGTIDDHGILVY